jgi:CheY-like chemotaxis protein
MSPDHIEKVFEPFSQADTGTTRNYDGTGLGLSITKNIVELMGGVLTVESSPGVGSAFSFEVTFDAMDATDNVFRNGNHIELEKPKFNGLILICDDNPMNQEVICEHLERVGIQTVVAENGKIGVDIVKSRLEKGEKPFDLIFMDMFMQVMDGIEASTIIRKLNTGTPIVAMTANIMASDLENYRKNGIPDHLCKPFTLQDLWRVLLKYMIPVSAEPVCENEQLIERQEQLKKLQYSFVKNNQKKIAEILSAIDSGDIKLAHRLAHTMKGNAGLIGKPGLQTAASKVEASLQKEDASVPEDELNSLITEFESVIEELKPLLDEPRTQNVSKPLTADQTQALFTQLETMLENCDTGCLELLPDIRTVPGAEKLADLIEEYDFMPALDALTELTDLWRERYG